jgi:hypothetical protein
MLLGDDDLLLGGDDLAQIFGFQSVSLPPVVCALKRSITLSNFS